jgi:hypothetical protein
VRQWDQQLPDHGSGRGGCGRMNTAERCAKNGVTECRLCQQNTNEHLKERNTVRLFGDEQIFRREQCHMFGIQKGYFHGNTRTDRCIGSNNCGIVILSGVYVVTT